MNWSTAAFAAHLRRMGVENPIAAACSDQPAKSKFNAEKTTVAGITFASGAEARHYQALRIAAEAGAITDLRLQPRFLLQEKFTDGSGKKHRAIYYVGDFEFMRDGVRTVVDVKSDPTKTPQFRIKWKLAIAKYPGIAWEMWK